MKMYCINPANHPHRVSFVSWRREAASIKVKNLCPKLGVYLDKVF